MSERMQGIVLMILGIVFGIANLALDNPINTVIGVVLLVLTVFVVAAMIDR